MSGPAPVGVGVIGLGFMGATHLRSYAKAANCRVVAVCDGDTVRLDGRDLSAGNIGNTGGNQLFDPAQTLTSTDPEVVLADERVDLVSVCTPTDTHVDLAIRALDAGKHVLVEKPVAISVSEVERLRAHAARGDRMCVPAMCMRYWPGWDVLPEMVRAGTYGRVLSARFERLGAAPAWAGFYADESRSGGALFDLHVHDVDMVHRCFGAASSVRSIGRSGHVMTSYTFDGGPAMVVAEGGWLSDPSAAFRIRYVVEFEGALAEFDLDRSPAMSLLVGGVQRCPELADETGYEGQARAVVESVRAGDASRLPTMGEAVEVVRTIELEAASLRSGRAETRE